MKRTIFILALAYALTGCNPENRENFLYQGSEISLTWKGDMQVLFNEQTGQIAFNDTKNEYRVYDDRLADWFTIKYSQKPVSVGETLTADVSWTGDRTAKTFRELTFTVEKISDEGLVWLWNQDNQIGIIIKDIQ